MNEWTSGYVADIGYTFGYYGELNPHRLRLAFLGAGLALPTIGAACELGFGQGLSTNIHAAASSTIWHGTDFNPSQAAFAQELACASGAAATLVDQSFEQFCQRTDLPDFDFIGLHGIWSWISDANRALIVDFISRKLKVGGVLYISYNTQPGWAAMVPMRDLLTEHSEVMGASGQGVVQRVDAALGFAEKLMATNPAYARANPAIPARLQQIKTQDRSYLAHEYFNRDWAPMSFSRMGNWLSEAKLSYACSANYLENVDVINLSEEQRALIKDIPSSDFRETVRDFCVNQQFRRDYWVKGPRKLSAVAQGAQLRAQRVILGQTRAAVKMTVKGALGEATLHPSVYEPILDTLADYRPRSIGELEQVLSGAGLARVLEAVLLLTGSGAVHCIQDDSEIAAARPGAARLNAYLLEQALGSADVAYLASPVTGGAFPVNRVHQLFLLARSRGETDPAAWAQLAWGVVAGEGQKMIKDGKPVESDGDNLALLMEHALNFREKDLPVLAAVGIASA